MRLAYKWRVLISVIFGIFMVILDSTVINVAFPTLREEFHAGINDAQWVISLYVMALGVSTPLAGYLADRFGIKRIYVLGLALFVVGSLASGFAPNLGVLIAARTLQGLGGGIALPLGTALLFGAFTRAEQGLAFGIFGIALVAAPALGPILGGWLVDQGLWRWIFFINVPIGALGVVLATSFLREQLAERKPRFDPLGFATSIIGFGAVLYAASIAASDGWTSTKVLTFFGIGLVGLVAFAIVELFIAPEPLLDIRMFKRIVFLLGTLVGWVSVLALFGAEFLLPLYLQTLRGRSALDTGVILLPLALASGVVAPFSGVLYDRFGARPLMVVGFGMLMINTWQFSLLTATTSVTDIILLLVVRGIALGLTVQTTLVISLSVIPQPEVARASSLSNATRQVVQAIGVAVLATVLTTTLSTQTLKLEAQYQNAPTSATSATFGICEPLPASVGGGVPVVRQQIEQELKQACTESLAGYEHAYKLTFYFAALALLLGLLLPGWPLRWRGRQHGEQHEQAATTATGESVAGDG